MNFTKNPDITNTHKQGTLKASYTDLVNTFGSPNIKRGEATLEKTQVEFHIEFVDGTVATIYDWKSEYPAILNDTWTIGGFNYDAVMQVKQEMQEKRDRDNERKESESESSSSSSSDAVEIVHFNGAEFLVTIDADGVREYWQKDEEGGTHEVMTITDPNTGKVISRGRPTKKYRDNS